MEVVKAVEEDGMVEIKAPEDEVETVVVSEDEDEAVAVVASEKGAQNPNSIRTSTVPTAQSKDTMSPSAGPLPKKRKLKIQAPPIRISKSPRRIGPISQVSHVLHIQPELPDLLPMQLNSGSLRVHMSGLWIHAPMHTSHLSKIDWTVILSFNRLVKSKES